jgi:peptidyl-prolyl cis-trans isomerase C
MQKQRKRLIEALMTVLILAVGASLVLAGAKTPKNSVAVVNGTAITKQDFDVEMSRAQQQLARSGQPVSDAQVAAIKNEVLENLINREVLYQESKKKGVKVDEATVDKEFAALKGRFSNEEDFKAALSKMDLSEANVRAEIERGMAVQQFVDKEFGGKITVSDEDSKKYYDDNMDSFKQPEQVCASHILVKVDPEAEGSKKAEARKKIEDVRKKLKKGEDFGTLAKEFSQCPSSEKGGDLGCFGRGQMVKPFEDAAFALEPGKVSGIVESNFGYHLIKVTEKKPAGTMAYADVKDRLQQYLKQERIQKELNLYVEELKKEGKIERFLPKGP